MQWLMDCLGTAASCGPPDMVLTSIETPGKCTRANIACCYLTHAGFCYQSVLEHSRPRGAVPSCNLVKVTLS